ncbi:MAG: response regulator transcription factor [Terracidiphilus sp.]
MASSKNVPDAIRIGVVADEPIRVAGLATIFDQSAEEGHRPLIPVLGTLSELLPLPDIAYIVVDLNSAHRGLEALETIRHERPDVRSIVIGPEHDDELVLSAVVAGARAYLGQTAGPELVRQAIDVVTAGSIWAPRRLLCRTIDRLLRVPGQAQAHSGTQLTLREQQVLELLLGAYSTREIASRLGIEQRTVKAHIGHLMQKTGVDNRIKLSLSALSHTFLPRESRSSSVQSES